MIPSPATLRGPGSTRAKLKAQQIYDAVRAYDRAENHDPTSPGVIGAEMKRARRRARNQRMINR